MAASEDHNYSHCMRRNESHSHSDKMKEAILHVWNILKDFIPLANTHGAEFFTQNHWDMFIPSSIGKILLTFNDDELANLPLGKLRMGAPQWKASDSVCSPNRNETTAVDGQSHLKNSRPAEDSHHPPSVESNNTSKHVSSSCDVKDEVSSATVIFDCDHELNSVVSRAQGCRLENLDILTLCGEAIRGLDKDKSKAIISEAMSEKKSHEVQLMSNAVATLVTACQADLVVDVGSGKGYLSLELADHHTNQRIGVLGLDSCETNTVGAKVRIKKLMPRWSGLVAKTGKQGQETDSMQPCEVKRVDGCDIMKAQVISHSERLEPESVKSGASSLYVPITTYVHPSMNLRRIISEHAAHLCRDGKKAEEAKLVLTGLHTCGSLSVTTMRLFTKDPGCVAVCYVGCCYQLMEEDNRDQSAGCDGDFPLSQFGKSLGLQLGRNARNLASQSVHRLQTSRQLQGKDFYWRALLDVLFSDLSLPVPEKIKGMRKLHKQCKNFYEYAVKAMGKLGLAPDLVTQKMAQTLEEKYQHEQIKMAAFFQYKLLFAPVIESLILLDRLLFLLEKDCVGQAFLVQLFDPVTSPRCYAVVAYKTNDT